MPVNSDKIGRWKEDIALSVDTYNSWFMEFAPKTYRDERVKATRDVANALSLTRNLTDISPSILKQHPSILPILRASTAPPIARDRLIGLAQVNPGLVKTMEIKKMIPPRLMALEEDLEKIGILVKKIVDKDIFTWLDKKHEPKSDEIQRAATIVADRLCGAQSDPIIRNSQERRQMRLIGEWLDKRGYRLAKAGEGLKFDRMTPGTYAFRLNIPITQSNQNKVNIPVDVVIMPKKAKAGEYPLLIETKSAGDFTNTNKRRKEEAKKMDQLRNNYGKSVRYVLFLCGYFNAGYLGYEAADGIDWVWEHRMDDLAEFGL